jgi:hypothetical protein
MSISSKKFPVGCAYRFDGEIVICGDPSDISDNPEDHNCDQMGCGSLDHVLYRFTDPRPNRKEEEHLP